MNEDVSMFRSQCHQNGDYVKGVLTCTHTKRFCNFYVFLPTTSPRSKINLALCLKSIIYLNFYLFTPTLDTPPPKKNLIFF